MNVGDIMTRHVVSVRPEDDMLLAIRLMLQHKISGLVVLDPQGALAGVVTEGDLLRRTETGTGKQRPRWIQFLAGPGKLAEDYVQASGRRIGEIMTRDVHTVTEETSLGDAVDIMERFHIKRLPVMRGQKVVGIVSRANFLHATASIARQMKPGPRQDSEIRDKLLADLANMPWAMPSLLNIVVNDGVVDLWGTITDERVRSGLVVAAENVSGVKAVRDHLTWVEPVSGMIIGPETSGETAPR